MCQELSIAKFRHFALEYVIKTSFLAILKKVTYIKLHNQQGTLYTNIQIVYLNSATYFGHPEVAERVNA